MYIYLISNWKLTVSSSILIILGAKIFPPSINWKLSDFCTHHSEACIVSILNFRASKRFWWPVGSFLCLCKRAGLTWHQHRSVSKGLTRRWENYRNCNLAALRPSIRVWPALIRWHTRSLAHRWRAGEASSSPQHPLELLSFSSTFLRTFAQQLIKKPQDVWTLASKHVRVHQVSLLCVFFRSWRFFSGRAMDQGNGSRYRKRWKSKRWF